MDATVPLLAGAISTMMFAFSTLPMLVKAFRTKDLRSYSLGNILLSNIGNLIHSIYVFHLPPGPIWLLHTFHLVTTGLMLFWYLRYQGMPNFRRPQAMAGQNEPIIRLTLRAVAARVRPRTLHHRPTTVRA